MTTRVLKRVIIQLSLSSLNFCPKAQETSNRMSHICCFFHHLTANALLNLRNLKFKTSFIWDLESQSKISSFKKIRKWCQRFCCIQLEVTITCLFYQIPFTKSSFKRFPINCTQCTALTEIEMLLASVFWWFLTAYTKQSLNLISLRLRELLLL